MLFIPMLNPPTLGHHRAVYDRAGRLAAWKPWPQILATEMRWYSRCPKDHGYPRFATLTFMDSNYRRMESRSDSIPAMQNGVGILSYLQYDSWTHHADRSILADAERMGDYVLEQALTPDTGRYPRFPRSTGHAGAWPQPPDCGSQDDQPYEIQPDKGALFGYALCKLFEATHRRKYFEAALHIGQVLVRNVGAGTATESPWPFRADWRTGVGRNLTAGDSVFFLRLFDELIASGHPEFVRTRSMIWEWVLSHQIPSAATDGRLFVQFFEDHHNDNNRTAWAPLNLAKYLIERKARADPDWQAHAATLIEFVCRTFTHVRFGVTICGEQDEDADPWGGILSTWGSTLAMYAQATGLVEYRAMAREALNLCLYAVADNGCPRDSLHNPVDGGWQEDAHTDKVHNVLDALGAFPAWGEP